MRILKLIVNTAWWLSIAYIPLGILSAIDHLYTEIGCSPTGDCYARGTIAAFELEMWAYLAMVLLWPICTWFLGGRWLAVHFGFAEMTSNKSLKPTPRGDAA